MTVSVNGNAHTVGSGTSVAVTITTTAPTVLFAVYANSQLSGAPATVSSITGGGLTWTRRIQHLNTSPANGFQNCFEVWWAIAPSNLSAQNITIGPSVSATHAWLGVFGLTGLDTSTLFDTHTGLPVVNSNNNNSNAVVNDVYSTSNANDVVLAFQFGTTASGSAYAAPTGFTELWHDETFAVTEMAYEVISSVQTSTTVQMASSNNSALYVDVVRQSSGGTTFTLTAAAGSYSINGSASSFLTVEPWQTGIYTITGSASIGVRTFPLPAAAGAYVIMGQAALLIDPQRHLLCDAGVYTITGFPAAPDVMMPTDIGRYHLVGNDAGLFVGRATQPVPGDYFIAGFSAELVEFVRFPIDAGVYSITGASSAIQLSGDFGILDGDPGVYSITGFAVDMFRFTPPEVTEIHGGGGLPPKDPIISQAELAFFRGAAYRRGIDALVPPQDVAQANLRGAPRAAIRPVIDRTPLRK